MLSHDSVSTLRAKSKSKPHVQRGRCSPPPPRETSGSVSAQRGPVSRCPPLVPSESPSRRTSWATTDPSDAGRGRGVCQASGGHGSASQALSTLLAKWRPSPSHQDGLNIKHVQTVYKSGKLEGKQQDLQARGRPSAPGQPSRSRRAGGDLISYPPSVLNQSPQPHVSRGQRSPLGHGRAPGVGQASPCLHSPCPPFVLSRNSLSTLPAK